MQKIPHFVFALCLMLTLSLLAPQTGTARQSPQITIINPGDGSTIVSPLNILAEVQHNPKGMIHVALVDKNGNTIARQLLRFKAVEGRNAQQFRTTLPFEIPTENTEALLSLTTLDRSFQPIALRSVKLNLQSSGESFLRNQTSTEPWVTITQPEPMDIFSGGHVLVAGTITPLTERPVIFELMTNNGRVIGSSQLVIEGPSQTFGFEIRLHYAFIKTFTDIRLIIRQTNQTYGVNVIMDSLPLGLMP